MASTIHPSELEKAIEQAIQTRTREIVEEEIKNACERVSKRMREALAETVMKVSSFYSMERMGTSIVIKVENRT